MRLKAEPRVLPIQEAILVVLDQRQVVGATLHAGRRKRPCIHRRTGRQVGALDIEAAVIAIHEIGTHRGTAAELAVDTGRVLPHVRRVERAAHLGRDASD